LGKGHAFVPSKEAPEFTAEELREQRLKHNISVGYCALIAWPFFLLVALFAGTAPGAGKGPIVAFECLLYAAAIPFMTQAIARHQFARGRYRMANWIALSPALVVGTVVGGIAVFYSVLSFLVQLQIFRLRH
jgi:hypothetical protein